MCYWARLQDTDTHTHTHTHTHSHTQTPSPSLSPHADATGLQLHDTVGVTSMHLWPGLIAWIFGMIAFIPLDNDVLKGDLQVIYITP